MINPFGSTALSVVSFDYTALSSFYQSGGGVSEATRRAVINSSGVLNALRQDASVIPPWDLRPTVPADDTERLNNILRGTGVIDLDDPLINRNGDNVDYKNLFALHRGLSRLRELVSYAEDGKLAGAYAKMLDKRFQSLLSEVETFANGLQVPDVEIVSGIKVTSTSSGITTPKPLEKILPEHYGAIVTDVRDDPIPGLSGTEQFTINVATSTTNQDIDIDLSEISGTVNLDNVVALINDKLETATVNSRFVVNRESETSYGLKIDIANGEELTFAAAPGSETSALYVTGASGVGTDGTGFLRKLTDLDAAEPAEAFRSEVATEFAEDARGVAVDSQGYVYVVGTSAGDLEGMVNQETPDAYLRKYDAAGELVWSRLLGSTTDAAGFSVAVDGNDDVVITGQTADRLSDLAYGGNLDTFVSKFDGDGREQWTRQAQPYADDAGLSVTTDASGNVFVAGFANSALSSSVTHAGGTDATLVKLDTDGNLVWEKQFGGTGDDFARAVLADDAGNVYVAAESDGRAVLRKYDDSGASQTPIWEADLGAFNGEDTLTGLAFGSDGSVYLSGATSNAGLAGAIVQAHNGGQDGFVTNVGTDGTVNWTSYVGSSGDDEAFGLAVRTDTGTDEIYLTGNTTGGFAGQTPIANADGFVARLDDTGATQWVDQMSGAFSQRGTAVAFDATGSDVVSTLGLPKGPIPAGDITEVINLTSARSGMSFQIKVNGGEARTISIEDDDSYGFLAFKINKVLGSNGFAEIDSDIDGLRLNIEARNGGRIDILAGPEGLDALAPLGLAPVTLFGDKKVVQVPSGDVDDVEEYDDNIFALGFGTEMNVLDKAAAADAGVLIDNAMRIVRDAYQKLNPSEEIKDPLDGVVLSQADQARINALQQTLNNLTQIAQAGSVSLFA
ncbi:MAG: SBBP repeat-containing protein [Alphaproteobacteria bacterium]